MRVKETIRLQAYFSVSPHSPGWGDVNFTAIRGYANYMSDDRLVDGHSWNFRTVEGAISVLAELRKLDQEHYLRVVRHLNVHVLTPIAGADILDRTMVDGPGTKPCPARAPFWGTSEKGLQSIVPASEIRDMWGEPHA